MTIRVETAAGIPEEADAIGVPVFSGLEVPEGAPPVDTDFLAAIGFEAKPGQTQALPAGHGFTVAVGMGERSAVDADVLRRAGAALARAAGKATTLATSLPAAGGGHSGATSAVVEGLVLGGYRFDDHRSEPRPSTLARVVLVGGDAEEARTGEVAAEATLRARTWVNQPPRFMTPRRLAEIAAGLGGEAGLQVEVWDEKRIEQEGLGGLAGVAAGATEPPRLIRLRYVPDSPSAHVALVGKGITFDSGGLSLKTAEGMMTMKSDMGGAAAVLAALCALPALRPGVQVTGYLCATENMPSGTAIHPGDVLRIRNGTTVEVLNTDAEGRLVLADGLSLAAEEEPDAIVDIATLTGAQRTALGSGVAAVLGNDDRLVARVEEAGRQAGEPFWRLPLWPAYRRQLDSEVADLKNIGPPGSAGTIIGGLFLQDFVGGRPWAHLDIAAPSWSDSEEGWLSKGATGWGARTFLHLLTGWQPLS